MKMKTNHAKKVLVALFAVLTPLMASAEKVEIDGIWYNLIPKKNKTAEVTFKGEGYDSYSNEYSGEINTPATIIYNGVTYSVTSIENYTFYYCVNLKNITLPEGITSIEDSAFEGCSNLKSLTIPNGVISIENNTFLNCSNLESITLPEGLTIIGERAFEGCNNLKDINLPEDIKSIGWCAFNKCSSLKNINLPLGITSIGDYAFCKCSSLGSVTIPEGITNIESYTFDGCSNLTDIILPKSVNLIDCRAFANCPGLTDVYCHAEITPSTHEEAFDGSYTEYATLHVPSTAVESYKSSYPWSTFGYIVALTNEEMGIDNPEFRTQDLEPSYNLQGYRVVNPTKGGIYIINGKKVAIK